MEYYMIIKKELLARPVFRPILIFFSTTNKFACTNFEYW